MNVINIAAYRFVSLSTETLPSLRHDLKNKANELVLKGTVLLSPEGINLFLAGSRDAVEAFKSYMDSIPEFQNLIYKESFSEQPPFKRMLVKLKKEIIPMGISNIQPEVFTAPYLTPEVLKQWYEEGHDVVLLDTRNDYEIELGTFKNAINLNLKHFRDFASAIKNLPTEIKHKPIVTFCTGGIRCEKAAALMIKEGFNEVYQLDGGILNYFEKCGNEHYEGKCFVFDERIAVDESLITEKII